MLKLFLFWQHSFILQIYFQGESLIYEKINFKTKMFILSLIIVAMATSIQENEATAKCETTIEKTRLQQSFWELHVGMAQR